MTDKTRIVIDLTALGFSADEATWWCEGVSVMDDFDEYIVYDGKGSSDPDGVSKRVVFDLPETELGSLRDELDRVMLQQNFAAPTWMYPLDVFSKLVIVLMAELKDIREQIGQK